MSQLELSSDRVEVEALYRKAGLDLNQDLEALAAAPRVAASPRAVGYLQSYFRANGHISMPVLTTRCSNNYGPYHFPEKLIPLFVTNLMEGKKVPLYGDGLNVRDWLYVEDHCDAVWTVLNKGKPGEVYNVGGNNEITNRVITETLIREMGKKWDDVVTHVKDRPGHDRRYAIDASKIKRELGWEPKFQALDAIIESAWKWHQKFPRGYED